LAIFCCACGHVLEFCFALGSMSWRAMVIDRHAGWLFGSSFGFFRIGEKWHSQYRRQFASPSWLIPSSYLCRCNRDFTPCGRAGTVRQTRGSRRDLINMGATRLGLVRVESSLNYAIGFESGPKVVFSSPSMGSIRGTGFFRAKSRLSWGEFRSRSLDRFRRQSGD